LRAHFFLWTHLYDPHRPYDPPEPHRSRYSDPYLGEIAFADEQIGRLLDALLQRGLLARTLVVVAGDHGESLGDHGERDHGIFVYENVLRVPLIISGPAVAPARVSGVVRLVDVMPTIANLVGLPYPRTDGVSVVGMMKGGPDLDLDVYAESFYPQRLGWAPLRTLRQGRFKLIDAPRPELYDLVRDPFEQRNIHGDEPALTSALTKRLADVAGSQVVMHEANEVDAELRERVSALGYLGATQLPARGEQRPDPKDCIATLNLNGSTTTASRACVIVPP
jgi:arylsulfatase A-like enzyme